VTSLATGRPAATAHRLVLCAMALERLALTGTARGSARIERIGVGTAAATRAGRRFVATGPSLIAAVGLCGALETTLRVGDVIVADEVLDLDTGATYACDRAASERVTGRRGTLVTAPAPLRTAAERGTAPGIAVDMESAPIACEAARAGIPFVAIRAVGDTADTELPALVAAIDGASQMRQAVRELRPRDAPVLARLAVGAALGAWALRRATGELIHG